MTSCLCGSNEGALRGHSGPPARCNHPPDPPPRVQRGSRGGGRRSANAGAHTMARPLGCRHFELGSWGVPRGGVLGERHHERPRGAQENAGNRCAQAARVKVAAVPPRAVSFHNIAGVPASPRAEDASTEASVRVGGD